MPILGLLLPTLSKLIERIIPDPAAKAAAKLQLLQLAQSGELAELDAETKQNLAAAGIVEAEAKSDNWLTAAWRPLTMLTFVVLIVCRLFGLTSVHVPDAEYAMLWELVKVGLGGYVIGRSAEKITSSVAPMFKK